MPTTDLRGLPALVDAISLVIVEVAALVPADSWLTPGLLSGNLPTLAACCRTNPWPPPAVVVAPGVDVPLAVPLPPLARWMTRKTIAATPIVAAPRYRTICIVPGRCGARAPGRGTERDPDARPGAARPSSPNPAAAGASKPGWP